MNMEYEFRLEKILDLIIEVSTSKIFVLENRSK